MVFPIDILTGVLFGVLFGYVVAASAPRRFSLRTLLVAMTLASVVLGVAVWALK